MNASVFMQSGQGLWQPADSFSVIAGSMLLTCYVNKDRPTA